MQFLVIEHIAFVDSPKGALLTMKVGRNTQVSLYIIKEVETYILYGATKIKSFIIDNDEKINIDYFNSKRVRTITSLYDNIEEAIELMLKWQKAKGFLEDNIIKTQAVGSWIGKKGCVIQKINQYTNKKLKVEKI